MKNLGRDKEVIEDGKWLRVRDKRSIIFLVVLSAYSAELKMTNKQLDQNNRILQDEIDTLDVKIKAANSLEHIETVATSKLGMVYANENECIYLSKTAAPKGNLASIIKENAYK